METTKAVGDILDIYKSSVEAGTQNLRVKTSGRGLREAWVPPLHKYPTQHQYMTVHDIMMLRKPNGKSVFQAPTIDPNIIYDFMGAIADP